MKYNKQVILQVLGCLMNKPSLILDNNYKIEMEDFPTEQSKFYRIIFGAIYNLAVQGAKKISVMEVDSYLSSREISYRIFHNNQGEDYLINIKKTASVENFQYNYNRLKKISLLNSLENSGFDISELYDEKEIDPRTSEKQKELLEKMDLESIVNHFEGKLLSHKMQYVNNTSVLDEHSGYMIDEMVERYKTSPEMGAPLQGNILNTIVLGARLKCFYLFSAEQDAGKTRGALGECANISMSKMYDWNTKKWIKNGFNEPSLFILTEQSTEQIRRMLLGFVSGVETNKIMSGKYTEEEYEIIKQSNQVIKDSPLYFRKIISFTETDIEEAIKTYKSKYGIGYVFFDYIFSNPELLSKASKNARTIQMREDQVLGNFGEQLKFIAERNNVHFFSSSQTNGKEKIEHFPDKDCIRGAKALADKIDVGVVMTIPRKQDLEAIQSILDDSGFNQIPNRILNIYKVRDGKYTKLRLWIYFDLGTCRRYDLFATTVDYELLDITPTNITKILEDNTISEKDLKNSEEDIVW